MNKPRSQTNPSKNEVIPVSERDEVVPVPARDRIRRTLKWVLTCLPLGGIIWASFLPLTTWMQQALILVALIWFYVFFLLDTFFLGG
jgi:polyferredoxin